MAGILDFLQSPEAQLGIGLLAAGGPTTDPNQTGFGQRLSGAMGNLRAQQAAQMDLQMKKAQLDQLGFALKKNQLLYDTAAGLNAQEGGPSAGQMPGMGAQPQGMPAGGLPAGAMPPGSPGAPTGMPQASGAMAAPGDGAPAGMAPQGARPPSQPMFGNLPNKLAAFGLLTDPSKVFESAASAYAPTDLQKSLRAIGIEPGSPEWTAAIGASVRKGNYIAPVSGRPGGYLAAADGSIRQLPHVPDGFTAIQGADGQFHMVPVDGGLAAMQQSSGATALGKAQAVPTVAYNGTQPIFSTQAQDVARAQPGAAQASASTLPAPMRNNNPGALMPGGKLAQFPTPEAGIAALDQNLQRYASQGINTVQGIISKWAPPNENNTPAYIASVSNLMGVKPDAPLNMANPVVRHMVAAGIMRQENGSGAFVAAPGTQSMQPQATGDVSPVLAPGVDKGAVLSQEELSGKYKDLAAANSSAPTVISRLQNIKMLAPGAITGAETNRRDFYNGLLSLAGIPGTADSKTASDLVDKNSAQIVSALRMGQGSAGSDALQTLLGAANPNRHMTAQAINEAADQLIASQRMNQAKAKLLTPVALSRDPQTYGAKELAFDQAADPRIWQWQGISDPAARKAFAASVMKVDPAFPQKIQTLEQMGALK